MVSSQFVKNLLNETELELFSEQMVLLSNFCGAEKLIHIYISKVDLY